VHDQRHMSDAWKRHVVVVVVDYSVGRGNVSSASPPTSACHADDARRRHYFPRGLTDHWCLADLRSGLADLNQCDLNRWFKSRFKINILVFWLFHLPQKNYNKQKQMYCFILLFNLFNSSTTDFTVTDSGTSILCNVQLKTLERFSAILAIYWYFTA